MSLQLRFTSVVCLLRQLPIYLGVVVCDIYSRGMGLEMVHYSTWHSPCPGKNVVHVCGSCIFLKHTLSQPAVDVMGQELAKALAAQGVTGPVPPW